MKSQIYLPRDYQGHLIAEVKSIVDLFTGRVFPVFSSIEQEADSHSEQFFENAMADEGESIDPADIADSAMEAGLAKYTSLSLAKYALLASSMSTLYQLWEQQVRLFLFREMRHVFKLNMATFCVNGIRDIKDAFTHHGVNIEAFNCWSKLNELRLLCNVIKHGDGASAAQLLERNPNLFQEAYRPGGLQLPIYSTLLEETLELSERSFVVYAEAIESFWREVPERSYEP